MRDTAERQKMVEVSEKGGEKYKRAKANEYKTRLDRAEETRKGGACSRGL